MWVSWVAGGISLVTSHRRRCGGRDASTAGGGEGGAAASVRVVGCRRISLGVAAGMHRRREERGEATLGVADLSWCRGPPAGPV